jgi:group I intron endonuclease
MHRGYIDDELWEFRDKPGLDVIRARYPKKGNIRCVYKFTNLRNGKSYIGQTGNLWARLGRHFKKNTLQYQQEDIYRAIRKYGINSFKFEVLLDDKEDPTLKTEAGRLIMEALCVIKYNSYNNGYNTQPTSTDSYVRTLIAEEPKFRNNYYSLPYSLI